MKRAYIAMVFNDTKVYVNNSTIRLTLMILQRFLLEIYPVYIVTCMSDYKRGLDW
jgi:hypothetical protein